MRFGSLAWATLQVALNLMPFTLALVIAAAWCLLSVFVIRHHRPKPDSFRKATLGEIYRDFVKEAPTLLKPRKQGLFLLGLTAIFSSFYPVLLLGGLRVGGGRGLFLLGGLVAFLGAGMNLILIVLSHTDFVGGSKCREETVLTWMLPLSQAVVAAASVAIGFSAGWVAAVRSSILH